jgi:hypothetical protein
MKVHHTASGRDFEIVPTLDGAGGYDPYVQHLIGRIRAGRPALECLFDANSLFLRSGRTQTFSVQAASRCVRSLLRRWRTTAPSRRSAVSCERGGICVGRRR